MMYPARDNQSYYLNFVPKILLIITNYPATANKYLLTPVRCVFAVQPLSHWNVRTFQCSPVAVSGPLYKNYPKQSAPH